MCVYRRPGNDMTCNGRISVIKLNLFKEVYVARRRLIEVMLTIDGRGKGFNMSAYCLSHILDRSVTYVHKANSILDDDDEGVTPIIIPTTSGKHKAPVTSSAQPAADVDTPKPASAIDITADDILPRLTSPNVTDLVLLSMVCHLAESEFTVHYIALHAVCGMNVLTFNKLFLPCSFPSGFISSCQKHATPGHMCQVIVPVLLALGQIAWLWK